MHAARAPVVEYTLLAPAAEHRQPCALLQRQSWSTSHKRWPRSLLLRQLLNISHKQWPCALLLRQSYSLDFCQSWSASYQHLPCSRNLRQSWRTPHQRQSCAQLQRQLWSKSYQRRMCTMLRRQPWSTCTRGVHTLRVTRTFFCAQHVHCAFHTLLMRVNTHAWLKLSAVRMSSLFHLTFPPSHGSPVFLAPAVP